MICMQCRTQIATCRALMPNGTRRELCYDCCCDTTSIGPCEQIDRFGQPSPAERAHVDLALDGVVNALRGARSHITANEWLYLCAHVMGLIADIGGGAERTLDAVHRLMRERGATG